MVRVTPRTARKERICSCRRTIKPGTQYLEHVISPQHDDLGNERWWRAAECSVCAVDSGRAELLAALEEEGERGR